MNRKQVDDHPLNHTLSQLKNILADSALIEVSEDVYEDYRIKIAHISTVISHISYLIQNTPAEFISRFGIDSIDNSLTNVLNELNIFNSDRQMSHIEQANTYIDQNVLSATWAFMPLAAKIDAPALDHIIDNIRESARNNLEALRSQFDGLQISLSELQGKINTNESVSENNLTNLQSKTNELVSIIDGQRNEIISASTEIKASYTSLSAEISVDFKSEAASREEKFKDFISDINKQSKVIIDTLERHEKSAKDIVQVVGNIGVTGNYQKVAFSEYSQANLWRWITVGLFTVAILSVLASIISHIYQSMMGDERPDAIWQFLIRVAIGTVIALPAFYTARESARHRTNADRAKQKELELASLGPFIELLPDAAKAAITERMADRYFGSEVEPHDIKSPISADDAAKILEAVAKVISSARK